VARQNKFILFTVYEILAFGFAFLYTNEQNQSFFAWITGLQLIVLYLLLYPPSALEEKHQTGRKYVNSPLPPAKGVKQNEAWAASNRSMLRFGGLLLAAFIVWLWATYIAPTIFL
jgi:hypothetical protein